MSFWSQQSTEPYRQFRFLVSFELGAPAQGADAGSGANLHFFAMKVDKPMFKVGEYNHKFINHQFNFPGRVAWDPVTITMVDIQADAGQTTRGPTNGPTGAAGGVVQHQVFREYIRKAGYPKAPTDPAQAGQGKDGINKQTGCSLGDITITQLQPAAGVANAGATGTGTHADGNEWVLKNAFLSDVKFGSLDYGSEDVVQIQMTVRYDYAEATNR